MASELQLVWRGETNLTETENNVQDYVNAMNDYISKAEEAVNTLKDKVEALKEQLDETTTEKEGLEKTITELNNQIVLLERNIEEVRTEVDRLTTSNEQLTAENENLSLENDRLTIENEQLTNDAAASQDEVQRLEGELTKANENATIHQQNIEDILGNAKEMDTSLFEGIKESTDSSNLIDFNKMEYETSNAAVTARSSDSIYVTDKNSNNPWSFTTTFKVKKGKKYRIQGTASAIFYPNCQLYVDDGKYVSLPLNGEFDKTFVAERSFIRLFIEGNKRTGPFGDTTYSGALTLNGVSLVEVDE